MSTLTKVDLWAMAKAMKVVHYLDRYFAKPGRHLAKGLSTAQQIQAQRA